MPAVVLRSPTKKEMLPVTLKVSRKASSSRTPARILATAKRMPAPSERLVPPDQIRKAAAMDEISKKMKKLGRSPASTAPVAQPV